MKLFARTLTPGAAAGRIVLLSTPLSLWGGFDVETGEVCDVSHPEHGQSLQGRLLAMTAARGSSSSSSALVEAVRRGTAPAAIILTRVDPILVIGSLIANDLYGVAVPILLLDISQWPLLQSGAEAQIFAAEDIAELDLNIIDARAPA